MLLHPPKRSYHPLVTYCYLNNLLSQEQLASIPYSTKNYWNEDYKNRLFGKEWFATHEREQLQFLVLQQKRFVFRCLKAVMMLLNSLVQIHSQCVGFKKAVRTQAETVVRLINSLKHNVPLTQLCKVFSISTQQFYTWKNKHQCALSPVRLCFKRYPFQLVPKAFEAIEHALKNKVYDCLPKVSIYYQLLNAKLIGCSLSTFYKYAALIVTETFSKKKLFSSNKTLRASRPFEYLHIDTTLVQTLKDGIIRLVAIKDNFSKAILHFDVVEGSSSQFVAKVLNDMYKLYNMSGFSQPIYVISDGGPENKGAVTKWICNLTNTVQKIIGKDQFMFSNNSIESVFHSFKNQFLESPFIEDRKALYQSFLDFVYYYNYVRYPGDLYGLHPADVLNGIPIDKHKFKIHIQNDKLKRYIANTTMAHCQNCGNANGKK
jgi:hypothetical protein